MTAGELSSKGLTSAGATDPSPAVTAQLLGGSQLRALAEEAVHAAAVREPGDAGARHLRLLVHAGVASTPAGASRARARGLQRLLVAALLLALSVAALLWDESPAGDPPTLPVPGTIAATAPTDPTLVTAMLAAAFQDQVAGHPDEATATYNAVLQRDPRNSIAAYNLAVIEQAAGHDVAATGHYEAALAETPDFVPALFNLAILRAAAGAGPDAITLYRRILALEPNDAAAHLNLGIALTEGGEPEAGASELRRATALDPTLAWRVPAE